MELVKVFLSYTRGDRGSAEKLSRALASAGVPHFIDLRIERGDNFVEAITGAMEKASHLVCLVSRASMRSPWVGQEVALARSHGVKVVPLLLEAEVPLEPIFDPHVQYEQIGEGELSDDEWLEHLINARMFEEGIVPAGLFARHKQRFPNEFFAAELLTQPLFLHRDQGRLVIRVNRSEVKNVVTSNVGRRHLCERFVTPRRSEWIELDRRILAFMREGKEQGPLEIPTSDLPLRWASGGVLSIVNCDGREWVPLFFRDILPYGWNVSLGSTERYFDERGQEIDDRDYSLEYELHWPWKFIVREFLEETLVLRDQPHLGGDCEWCRFEFPQNVAIRVGQQQAERFAKDHLDLRRNQDGLCIRQSVRGLRIHIHDDTATDVEIAESGMVGRLPGAWDVLVAINPVELGVEIIKVFEYAIDPSHCLLDGEVYQIGGHHQMVRMPMGLISLRYLYENFGAADYQLEFNDQPVQPSVEGTPFKTGDIRVFRWDYDRRVRVWGGGRAQTSGRESGSPSGRSVLTTRFRRA